MISDTPAPVSARRHVGYPIDIGRFRLVRDSENRLWLINDGAEAMVVNEPKLEAGLDEFFQM